MNIVITGAPGAGKDTLTDKLRDWYDFIVLNTGLLYREEAQMGTEFGLKAKEYWGCGNLCPNEMTNELMERAIRRLVNKKGIVFNGYPRSVEQAAFLDGLVHIDMNLHMDIPEEVAVSRLLKRGREDDSAEIVKQRFNQYELKTVKLFDYYSNSNRRCVVNANLPEDRVLTESLKVILHNIKL